MSLIGDNFRRVINCETQPITTVFRPPGDNVAGDDEEATNNGADQAEYRLSHGCKATSIRFLAG